MHSFFVTHRTSHHACIILGCEGEILGWHLRGWRVSTALTQLLHSLPPQPSHVGNGICVAHSVNNNNRHFTLWCEEPNNAAVACVAAARRTHQPQQDQKQRKEVLIPLEEEHALEGVAGKILTRLGAFRLKMLELHVLGHGSLLTRVYTTTHSVFNSRLCCDYDRRRS
jgi:hypothetical protein